jgi:mannose-6-phosphate isomerase-like protein (cupin superfamily)
MADIELKDFGNAPYAFNIEAATIQNTNFRRTQWTGKHLQVTLMSIPVGGDIGLEVHEHLDQFLRVEAGIGKVQMGETENNLTFEQMVEDGSAILVPAGKWHNLTNTGDSELKIYSIYAPTEHKPGTVHATRAEADAAEHHD